MKFLLALLIAFSGSVSSAQLIGKTKADKKKIHSSNPKVKKKEEKPDDCAEAKACSGADCAAQTQCAAPMVTKDKKKSSSDDDDDGEPNDPKFEDQGFDED